MADIDFDAAASQFPDLDDIGGGIPSTTTKFPDLNGSDGAGFPSLEDDDDFAAFSSSVKAPPTEIKVTGDDVVEKFESSFPDLGQDAYTAPPIIPQATSLFSTTPQQQSVYGAPIYAPVVEEEVPEVIREWQVQKEEQIRQKDERSERRRQDTITQAERDIDNFYLEYNAKKERNIKDNKQSEAEYLDSLTDSLAAGTTWSRICDLIDLQNSQSKTLARAGPGTTDLTRMKEVLLRLRREGENAPGAAGY
ncbi:hypothetical protein FRC03_004306 [Tulasnella sp. 419]|nr:hypothetical protein FRC02_011886 [Tulasnella sp. 418]KAG8941601.1 hypothetical protein FRC03_004306 [Tulasnella sp. 419]